MKQIVIFTEEHSIVPVIKHLLRKLGVPEEEYRIIPHNGISTLKKSLSNKLRAWHNRGARFLVVCDSDSADCVERKQEFIKIATDSGRGHVTTVRIVCRELEAWFIGDRQAMHEAEILDIAKNPSVLRGDPDKIKKPSVELEKLLEGYPKGESAHKIAPYMDLDRNVSNSFKQTLKVLKKLAASPAGQSLPATARDAAKLARQSR